jgi:ABC-type spermidine/putrescine transport system permease subunit II
MSLLDIMTVVLPAIAFGVGMLTLFGEVGYSLEQRRTLVAQRSAARAAAQQARLTKAALTAQPSRVDTAPASALAA